MKHFLSLSLKILLPLILIVILLSQGSTIRQLVLQTGLIQEEIYIAGTGSMYPTFPKGEGDTDVLRAEQIVAWPHMKPYPTGFLIFGKELFGYKIQRGDIVSFSNSKVSEITSKNYSKSSGFVKRVVAVAGDTLEIRDGFVLVNGKKIDEPYTAKPRSTYGGEFLSDCQTFKVPAGKLFVMGDNRKESLDSRHELGLISLTDVDHVMSMSDQASFKSKWRDTTRDEDSAFKPSLDVTTYLALLNEKRREEGLKALTYNEKLAQSAFKRGQTMLQYNDLSFEATRSGYTMARALADVGYYNIVKGEAPVLGFYEAEELINGFMAFPDTKEFILNSEFQETGVAVVVGEINNCPSQVVVQHLAGYLPPNYDLSDIENWKKLIQNLASVLPSWEKARENEEFYNKNRDKLDRMISLIHIRINQAKAIVARMEANQWLTSEEEGFAKQDKALHEEQQRLANELNKQ